MKDNFAYSVQGGPTTSSYHYTLAIFSSHHLEQAIAFSESYIEPGYTCRVMKVQLDPEGTYELGSSTWDHVWSIQCDNTGVVTRWDTRKDGEEA